MIKKQNKILTLLTWETINVIELYCFNQFCQSCDRNVILAISTKANLKTNKSKVRVNAIFGSYNMGAV